MVTKSRDPQPAPGLAPPSHPLGADILGLDKDATETPPKEVTKKDLRIAYAGLIIFVATLLWMAFALFLIRRP